MYGHATMDGNNGDGHVWQLRQWHGRITRVIDGLSDTFKHLGTRQATQNPGDELDGTAWRLLLGASAWAAAAGA